MREREREIYKYTKEYPSTKGLLNKASRKNGSSSTQSFLSSCPGKGITPGLHHKIPPQKIFARVWVAQEPIRS